MTGQLAHRAHARVALGTAANVTLAISAVARGFQGALAVLARIAVFAVVVALIPAIAAVAARETIVAAILGARRIAGLRAVFAWFLVADRRAVFLTRRGVLAAAVGSVAGLIARAVTRVAITTESKGSYESSRAIRVILFFRAECPLGVGATGHR